jgi:hypothetical protein
MRLPSWSLRSVLPRLEIDWLLPFWLLLAILGAAVAETVTIGLGVWRTYQVWTGWLVGGVVASSQAMGSMMWARASQHNASKRIFWPAAISVLAGIVSGWVGLYLYQQSELTGLGRALAVASPAGSIAAAVLNGVFASGEAAIAEYEEQRGQRRKPTQASEKPATQAQAEPTEHCWCGEPIRNRYAKAAHSKTHLNEIAQASSVAAARELLESAYPGKSVPGMSEVAKMWRKATG